MQELYSKVTAGKYPAIPKHFSPELSKIVGLCLQVNPILRPSAKELIQMPPLCNNTEKIKAQPAKKNHFRSNS